jgi:hypothetical protein
LPSFTEGSYMEVNLRGSIADQESFALAAMMFEQDCNSATIHCGRG